MSKNLSKYCIFFSNVKLFECHSDTLRSSQFYDKDCCLVISDTISSNMLHSIVLFERWVPLFLSVELNERDGRIKIWRYHRVTPLQNVDMIFRLEDQSISLSSLVLTEAGDYMST